MTAADKRAKFSISFEGMSLLYKIHIVWLARILSEKLLAEVVYTVLQIERNEGEVRERELLSGKTGKFREISEKYFMCFLSEREETKKEEEEE